MDRNSPIIERFESMPRAGRWLVVAVVLVVLFLGWDQTIGVKSREWRAEAESIESQVRAVRESDKMTRTLTDLKNTVISLGPVTLPVSDRQGRNALSDAVREVFANYNIREDYDLGGGGDRLRQDISHSIVRSGNRVSRLTATVKFTSSPDDAIAIIADFESRDDIEGISKVRLSKGSDGRKVDVSLTLEAWVEVPPNRRRSS